METQLQYDSRRKTLGIVAKEHFVTDDNVVRDPNGWYVTRLIIPNQNF